MRRSRDWGHPCPHAECPLFKRRDRGHVSVISTARPERGKRRSCRCQRCETTFSAPRATVFGDLRPSAEKGRLALQRLLGRVERSGISGVRGGPEETGLGWRGRAAATAHEIHAPGLRHRPGTPGHRDERGPCLARQHAREPEEAGARVPAGEDGRQGGGGRLAPACRLMRAAVGGPRTRATAPAVVARTKTRVAGSPACCSDGFTGSLAARRAAVHVVTPGGSTGKRGRPRQPVCAPHPALVSGPWVTQQQQGTLRTRSPRVVLGAERLHPLGLPRSTAGVERVHRPWRRAWRRGRARRPASVKPARAGGSGGLLPGLLPCGATAQERAEAVANARAPTPRRAASPRAGAHAGEGGRRDGARLDLACAAHGHMRTVRFSKYERMSTKSCVIF